MSAPVIGAALALGDFPSYRDWLFEKDRDVEIQDFFDPRHFVSDGWRAVADQAKKLTDGFRGRLGIHGPFYGMEIASFDAEARGFARRRLLQGLEAAEAIGARQMVMHSPYTTWDYNNLDMDMGAREALIERVHETMRPVVSRGEAAGVVLVIENIEDVDPRDRCRLAESFASDAVRVSLDTGHAHYAHVSNGAPPVDYFARIAGGRLHHVHLQDADGHADRHWAIGEGNIPWQAVFRAIAETGANPHLVLELKDKGGIPASMTFLEAAGLAQ